MAGRIVNRTISVFCPLHPTGPRRGCAVRSTDFVARRYFLSSIWQKLFDAVSPSTAHIPSAAPHLASGPTNRSTSTIATIEEVRMLLLDVSESNLAELGAIKNGQDIHLPIFQKLMRSIIPTMGTEESKAFFMSMDTSADGIIQPSEIFSNLSLSMLRNRINHPVVHPLEGSYHCLPWPPFHNDEGQLHALAVLKKVYDGVVEAHSKPLQVVEEPVMAQVRKDSGVFASMFGGVRRTKRNLKDVPKVEFPPPKANAPKGAYLHGGCGCGKTVLLDLFFRSLPEGFTARRLHWHEFIRDAFRAMQSQPPGENVFVAMAEMLSRQFRVLLLDELIITHISEAILVKSLFRHLWARGMTIITTSNYLPEELYAKGFNRDQFVDFIPDLESQCPVIRMDGKIDYRKTDAHLAGEIFFHPITSDTTQKFNKTLGDVLVQDSAVQDVPLPIPQEKRQIIVPLSGMDARGATVARFSFNDLCVPNLGRAEYSAIAENFHTVFIENVPKFKPDLGTEFRRFVSLMDILYGKKVSLYLLSEVHTDELFTEGMLHADMDIDELWAFRRCSSMLSEMQNAKYNHMVWLMRNHMLQKSALKL